jgi:hypothetical protein
MPERTSAGQSSVTEIEVSIRLSAACSASAITACLDAA